MQRPAGCRKQLAHFLSGTDGTQAGADENQTSIKAVCIQNKQGARSTGPQLAPGNPLAWLPQPAAMIVVECPGPSPTGRCCRYPSPPVCDSAFSHLSHLRQPLLLRSISTNTMSYDIDSGRRRIPTLVQYCQRGEDNPQEHRPCRTLTDLP